MLLLSAAASDARIALVACFLLGGLVLLLWLEHGELESPCQAA